MKKSAIVGWTCLALAGWFSYVKLERGDATLAIITELVALVFAGIQLASMRSSARRFDKLSSSQPPQRSERSPASAQQSTTPPVSQPMTRSEWLRAQNAPLSHLRAQQVRDHFDALEHAADTAQREPVRIALAEGRYLDVVVVRNAPGVVAITITGHGFRARQFNTRVLKRLQRIEGATWKEPSISAQKPAVIEVTGGASSVAQSRVLWAIARLW